MRHVILATAAVLALGTLAACNPAPAAPAGPTAEEVNASIAKAVADARAEDAIAATAAHAEPGPPVYFVNITDGDTVTGPIRIVFGVYGKGVAPKDVNVADTGHHHLLIDTELSAEEMGFAIPNDAQHMHFGGGQTEVTLPGLPAGQHTLQLVFGDMKHEQMKPPMLSKKITITVK